MFIKIPKIMNQKLGLKKNVCNIYIGKVTHTEYLNNLSKRKDKYPIGKVTKRL